jgi:hypothetical protein
MAVGRAGSWRCGSLTPRMLVSLLVRRVYMNAQIREELAMNGVTDVVRSGCAPSAPNLLHVATSQPAPKTALHPSPEIVAPELPAPIRSHPAHDPDAAWPHNRQGTGDEYRPRPETEGPLCSAFRL